jgi:hypothetical protein
MFDKAVKNSVVTITAFLFAFIVSSVWSQEYVTDGLLGFWTMDREDIKGNVAQDVSGNNNHGEIGGNPEIVKGKIQEALHFNGTDVFVSIPDLGNEPTVSVEVWAMAESPFPDIRGLVSTFDPPQWKAGSVHFKFEAGNIDILKNDGERIQIPAEPNLWYHCAYTSDTTNNELKLYVNGELIGKVKTGAAPNNLTHLRIGSEHDGRYFPGILDEVRIYKRVLTDKEIEQNYNVKANSLEVNPLQKLGICWGKIKSITSTH